MVKVLHINSNYLTSKLHENLLDNLKKKGIKSTVFMPIKFQTKDNILYESKHEVYNPVSFHDFDKYIFTWKQNKIYRKLHHYINVNEYNMTHAHTLFTDGNVAYQLKKKFGIPYIVTVRGDTDIENFFKKRINLRNRGRKILENAFKVVFISEKNRDKLLNKYVNTESLKLQIFKKSTVIPNGIDSYYLENEGIPKNIDSLKSLKFIQVGKLIERKNGLGSLKGIKEYIKNTENCAELIFVGDIIDKRYVNRIKKEGKGIVSFYPSIKPEKLIELYREADIFIMPSFTETFGLVYPEAMSQGLPVLYTKGQGFDGQYPEGYVGYSVSANDPKIIAEKIECIVNKYPILSQNALEAHKRFNWSELAQQYVNIYKNCSF